MLIVEEIMDLHLCLNLICLGVLGLSSEYVQEIFILPLLDVIVFRIHPMDEAFDCVSFVAYNEAARINKLTWKR